MKTTYWFILIALLSTRLIAQQATNPPAAAPVETPAPAPALTNAPPTPPPPTNAPAAKAEKKKPAKKQAAKKAPKKDPAAELKSEPLVAGPATVIASNVNVRGQAKLKSEVVTHVTKGQAVTVLEELVNKNSAADEPSAWAKILLPPGAHAWVNTSYIDSANKTVRPAKLNIRSGPGENYSVLGTIQKGDAVKELNVKGDWTEIEPPSGAYAFVAAVYLKQEAPAAVAIAATPEPAPAAAPVTEPPTIAAAPGTTPAPDASTAPSAVTNAATTPAPEPAPVVEEPLPKRIVQREGVVRGTFSIQAPTKFELANPDNGRTINYLYTLSPDLDLKRYKGLRIVVTGEEGLDERWRNTPIITIQKIEPVE